ncbi:LysR family transcriptional regulator [Nonomuraea africana]|uniref:DNA-binding transcriptional LysR family regulator n=1 Tax=Nonomuraea africana TaxID=46171 RepID=A0ABR9KBS2_9ACTN|nr:LysR family transcriptional regulator [Nonomuraea africana]MBE1559168.1 DNA-binding transcriptional LysR family regulator [Nonomuraea africana]
MKAATLDQHEIETFLTLAEELHFRRTAERLGLSQGRTSQIISKLERRIGAALFERTSRRVSLTPLGRQLRDGIEPAYRQIQQEIAKAVDTGRKVSGTLRLGFLGPATAEALTQVIDAFRGLHPDCEVQLTMETQLDDHLAPLRDGTVDMLATLFPVREPDITVGPALLRESYVLAVSARHPFARRDSVVLDDLARDTVLSIDGAPAYWLDSHSPQRTSTGEPIRRGPLVKTFQAVLALVAAGTAMTPLTSQATRYYARPDVAYIPIADAPQAVYGLVWRSAAENARIRAFADLAARTAPAA